MKLRHKKMARSAFRSQWHVRRHMGNIKWGPFIGPFAKWHEKFRSFK